MLANGVMPVSLDELDGNPEVQPCYGQTYLAPGEVFSMFWQGGGGYGDPVTRDVQSVSVDVRDRLVSAAAAHDLYGVVLDHDGHVDESATKARRDAIRAARLEAADTSSSRLQVDLSAGVRLDENLVKVVDGGRLVVACAHCGTAFGGADDERLDLVVRRGRTDDAGPRVVSDTSTYVDEPVEFRQYFCPGCSTVVSSAVVPHNHPDHPREIAHAWRALSVAKS